MTTNHHVAGTALRKHDDIDDDVMNNNEAWLALRYFHKNEDAIINNDACDNGFAMGNHNNDNTVNCEEVADGTEEVAYDQAAT